MNWIKNFLVLIVLVSGTSAFAQGNDPLPSWNEGPIKQALIQFVKEVTAEDGNDYVAPANRIATFDNDGTLWVEQPMYPDVVFSFDRIKVLATQHPKWKSEQPFSAVLAGHYNDLSLKDIIRVVAETHSGMTVEQFKEIEKQWLATAVDARYKRHYTELVYKPMLEVMDFLRENNFKVYIVSGGEQDFIRNFAEKIYGVPPEQVIGTTTKTNYIYQDGQPKLVKMPEILFVSNKTGKPEAINLFIGKKPIIAFGNSDGDREMLEWTQSNVGKHMMVLVHHDDAQREYAYDAKSKIGTFSDALMQEAKTKQWDVISMKNDWKVIFPF